MRTAGTVNFCNVMGANGRSKGCGLVEFATPEEAQHAIQTLHDSELDGRKIFCREDRENKPIGGGNHTGPRKRIHNPSNATRTRGPNGESIAGRQVFVGNLPWTATSIDLVENFGTCGTVVTAEVSQRSDGRSAGFGTVLFETEEAAANAISQFNHGEFDGRPMVVKLDAKVCALICPRVSALHPIRRHV
jgi:RNA recognition motif-containing protein|eukprot:COSAG06_NODE_8637_length_2108_cov_12.781604_4_plen_190_part_00